MAILQDMNPHDVLRGVGLEEKEVEVYMALLEYGEATVLQVSRKAGVKRPTAYLVLSDLEAKGFVSRITKGKKTLFAPQHPKKILTEAEIKLNEIKSALPQFEAMLNKSDDRPRIMIYEGKDALDRAYDDVFIVKGEVLFMNNTALVEDVFERTLNKWNYATLSENFLLREIIDDSEASHLYASKVSGKYRHIRFMPKEFSPFATEVAIFGNNTLITSGKKEYFTVKIESKDIADAFRAMFEAMWLLSKESTGV